MVGLVGILLTNLRTPAAEDEDDDDATDDDGGLVLPRVADLGCVVGVVSLRRLGLVN